MVAIHQTYFALAVVSNFEVPAASPPSPPAHAVPVKKRTQLTHVDALIGQAGDLLKQMEIEVRSTQDASTKKELAG